MKATVMVMAMFMTGMAASAGEMNDTVKIEKPDYVTIHNDSNGYHIAVKGSKDNRDYTYETTRTFEGCEDVEVKHEVEFTVPFSKYWEEKEKRRSHKFSPHWNSFGIGFNNVVSNGTGTNDGFGKVSANMGKSVELFFNYVSASYGLGGGFGVFTGAGIDWRNFRMDGDFRFAKDGKKVTLTGYPDGADIKFSRLKVFSVTIPFMLEWQLHGHDSFFVSAGPLLYINAYGSLLTRYDLDGNEVKKKEKGVHYLPITVDFMGQIGFGDFSFYIKYSPCRIIQKDYGPCMHPLTCGIMFHW